ncbi:hypothetical protein DAMA08_006560 [Martiniozyma asiatica (nom. inval.)]|nr:hypothetical protein DAMA08_006560 [Martiniozyma asiatica]
MIQRQCLAVTKRSIFPTYITSRQFNNSVINWSKDKKATRTTPENALSEEEKKRILHAFQAGKENDPTPEIEPISFKSPWYTPFLKLFIVFVPCVLAGTSYIAYETYQGKPAFFPLWVNSAVPLEKATGFEDVDIEMLKNAAKDSLWKKLNMNAAIKENFGFPLTLGDYEEFDVKVEYTRLAFEGIEIDFTKSWWPQLRLREIESPKLPRNVNRYIQPLKAKLDGDIDQDPDMDSMWKEETDYVLKIRARVIVLNEKIHRIEPGSGRITFNAEVEFDHTRMIRITSALMHFRNKNGSGSGGTLEKLW